MTKWLRRGVGSIVAVALIVVAYAAAYQFGMAQFEGETVGFVHSIQVVVEAVTTAGFGGDAPWESPEMNLFVVAMNLTGVLLVFLALPVFLVPLLEDALATDVPTSSNEVGHVVICGHTSISESLRGELEAIEVPYVFVVEDLDQAEALRTEGWPVVVGDPTATTALEAVNLPKARALIANVDDEVNASIVLAASQVAPSRRIVSVVEEQATREYHQYAGADDIIQPRQVLGQSLARKATTSLSTELDNAIELGDDLAITELRIQQGSDLAGKTLAGSGIRERFGLNVIGTWHSGEFEPSPKPDHRLDENTILVVAGGHEDLSTLKSRTITPGLKRSNHVIVVGNGLVGQTAAASIRDLGREVVVIDDDPEQDPDVLGDARDRSTYRDAGIEDATTVVLALGDDTASVYASLVVEQLAPGVEVIARANEDDNVAKLYRAGADYVISLSSVTGRMLATNLLDEEVLTPETQLELIRTTAPDLTGRSLGDADVRARTGATVVAVERGADVLAELGPEFTIEPNDVLLVAGDDEAIAAFTELVGVAASDQIESEHEAAHLWEDD
ncbi:MAG TPA: NAD-binding protein [Natronoarchaeum rubrum]|nr:NAD-binding protein [Natronoarchaeum rubrum]